MRRRGGDVEEEEEEDNEFLGEYDVSFEFRFETAKLLLELDENTDEAIDVLEAGPVVRSRITYIPLLNLGFDPR